MWFTSDNAGPAAPQILRAVAEVDQELANYAMPYGNDPVTLRVTEKIRQIFEAPNAEVRLVATGTAANSIALATMCPPYAGVWCHKTAHIEMDECGAPEFYMGGGKLQLVDGAHGRIDPQALRDYLVSAMHAGVHNIQRGALSLTQATELGAAYTPAQIAELTAIAREYDMPVHMDGTRFANALVRQDCTPAELSWKAGVDVLCLGATKNGAMGAEAVIMFNPEKDYEFQLRRKRGGHLFSKMRYVAAQFDAYLTDNLWLDLAGRANAAADRLKDGIEALGIGEMPHPVEANVLFPTLPRAAHDRARALGANYYFWPHDPAAEGPADEMIGARFVCNWATRDEDIDAILAAIKG